MSPAKNKLRLGAGPVADGVEAGSDPCAVDGEIGGILENEKSQPHQRVALIFVGVRPLYDTGADHQAR